MIERQRNDEKWKLRRIFLAKSTAYAVMMFAREAIRVMLHNYHTWKRDITHNLSDLN